MPDINQTQLELLARGGNADLELHLTKTEWQAGKIHQPGFVAKEGWWGGRLMRQIKIALGEDRTSKQERYQETRQAVLNQLISTYGVDIGLLAFRAGIGGEAGAASFSDHPLTGRHIAKMLRAADDTVGSFRGMAKWVETIRGEQDLPGRKRISLGEKVSQPGERLEPSQAFGIIRDDLLSDRTKRQQPHGFWMIAVEDPSGAKAMIGVHVAADSDFIDVHGADGGTVRTTKNEFAGWLLDQFGRDNVDVKTLALYRVEEHDLGERQRHNFLQSLQPPPVDNSVPILRSAPPPQDQPPVSREPRPDRQRDDRIQELALIGPEKVKEINESYRTLLGRNRAGIAFDMPSPSLLTAALGREPRPTIRAGHGEPRPLSEGDRAPILERLQSIKVAGSADRTVELDRRDRAALTRFMDVNLYTEIHGLAVKDMGGRPLPEPEVHFDIAAFEQDGKPFFEITMRGPLPDELTRSRPDVPEGRGLDLLVKVRVPQSELRQVNPQFELLPPQAEFRQERVPERPPEFWPRPQSDPSRFGNEPPDLEGRPPPNDTAIIVQVPPRDDQQIGGGIDPRRGRVLEGDVIDEEAVRELNQNRRRNVGRNTVGSHDNKPSPSLWLATHVGGRNPTIRAGHGEAVPLSRDDETMLRQLEVIKLRGSPDHAVQLQDLGPAALTRFMDVHIFDDIYRAAVEQRGGTVGREIESDIHFDIEAIENEGEISYEVTMRGPMPDDIAEQLAPGEGVDLVVKIVVPHANMRGLLPDFHIAQPVFEARRR